MSQLSDTVLLEDHLKRLRLPAMLREYPECARQAREGGESYEGFLLNLATRELTQRQANQLKRRLKEARFPVMKTLEGTDFKKWPGLDALQVRELLQCDYIPRRENLAFIGRHGTGKSHAATTHSHPATREAGDQAVLRLGQRYGATALDQACHRALSFDNLRLASLKEILEKGLWREPTTPTRPTSPAPAACRFARPHDYFVNSQTQEVQ